MVRETSSANATLIKKTKFDKPPRFVVCLDNSGYEVSLEVFKVYAVIPDTEASMEGDVRIIDESGEDYLYDAKRFAPIALPKDVERAILKRAS